MIAISFYLVSLYLNNAFLFFMSCSSIQIFSDHDSSVDFSGYKTFAYFKTEIDQVNISDLSSGVYMMNITSEKGSVTKKIIKN